VECKSPLVALLWKISGLALFGLLAIALAGPILAMLAVVLSFAAIGFVCWLPCQALLRRYGPRWRVGTEQVHQGAQRGADLLAAAWCGGARLACEAPAVLRGGASFVGTILLETLSGALVGILLVSTCWPQHSLAVALPLAALIGMVVGVLVVVSRPRSANVATEQSPEGLL